MDRYSKVILTVIAALLAAVTYRLFTPSIAAPAYADLEKVLAIEDPELKAAAYRKFMSALPVTSVHGGNITVDGKVGIEGDVTVDGAVEIKTRMRVPIQRSSD